MAELDTTVSARTGTRLSWAQFRAIAWLRWRILANSFRRKGGAAELVGRVLLLPLLAFLALLPTLLAGFFAWFLSMHGSFDQINLVFWATFALTQLLNINTGQPGTTFDPTELIRFPMALRSFVLARLCFGLLAPSNVIVSLMSAAIFVGITVDRPHLWPWTLLACGSFALANVLFSRMIFAWVDRWLSTRRAREIFTGLIFTASIGFQYLNVTYNPGFRHGRSHQVTPQSLLRAQAVLQHLHPWLRFLPPELSAGAILAGLHHSPAAALLDLVAIALYAIVFLAVYTLRMRAEYRGENLSDAANAVPKASPKPASLRAPSSPAAGAIAFTPAAAAPSRKRLIPPTLGPLLAKEFLVLRRNTGLLYGIIAPTVMVFLFAGRMSLRGGSHWLLLLAVAYALLGLAAQSYNSFGLEGPGAQFYFMAPVPLSEVFFAKNVMQFLLALFEVVAVIAIVATVAGRPHLMDVLFVLLWAVATLLLNTVFGNLRSISAPKKVNPGRAINRAQSPVSAWIAIGLLGTSAALGAGLQLLAGYLHLPWLSIGLVALLALGALFAYSQGLRGIEAYALNRRESLFEELGKKT